MDVHVHARGAVFSRKVLMPPGNPRNPMTTDERRKKFLGCLAGTYAADQARAMVDKFERLDKVNSFDGLVPPPQPPQITPCRIQATAVSA